MSKYRYKVIFEPAEDGGWYARIPALDNIVTEGNTLEEAKEMAADAILCYVESLKKEGLPIPQDDVREPIFEHVEVSD